MALKFYTSVVKAKTKSQKVLRASSCVCRIYRGKAGSAGDFVPIVNKIKFVHKLT